MKTHSRRLAAAKTTSYGMVETAARLENDGLDVIHLELGRPSFDTPQHIKEAVKVALDQGYVHYDDLQGLGPLREALSDKLRRDNSIDASDEDILITVGLSQGASAAYTSLIDQGDEVIFLDPYYPQHLPRVSLMGGRAVSVPLSKSDNWALDLELIESAVNERTVALTLVNPANPVGRVFTRNELESLGDLAHRHDLVVISDEVYEAILFDGHTHTSLASLPDMWDRTVTLISFTKAYAMDGWRIGYAVAPPHLLRPIMQVANNQTTHPTIFAQYGALAAVSGDQACVAEMVAEDTARRDLVVARLNAMPGVSCAVPQGAIYAFPDVSAIGLTSDTIAAELIRETGVAVESGSFYGAAGEGYLRVCFGSQPAQILDDAMDRIHSYFARKT